ncbi:MAG TPA: glycine cleavage T C-terminal barrel domain-containing protein [Verrucomicrobiae bacterium]|jgi:folate-binding protein YgfZ|nr:glycine cleavage T C-terminal barrel domain-containing protein [Verrucomicrobiae bacterium]
MSSLSLHELHHSLAAQFRQIGQTEVVASYGDVRAEHAALRETAGVLDLSFRSRICLTGADRVRFLHGQVTNDIKRLRAGEGCYAAVVTAKGKMESDLNIYALQDELLLDFEPGLTVAISQRLERYIVADDVQVVDVAPHYGLLSVQGPEAATVVEALKIFGELPAKPFQSVKISDETLGEIYLVNQPRLVGNGMNGFDLFVPIGSLGAVADKLIAAAKLADGRACGWDAFEMARIEAGVPRFGADMDESNIPLECGIEARAVSYNKGCYIGQEVINRIHSIGHVNKELRGLRLADDSSALPAKGDKLFHDGKEVGYVTSALKSEALDANIALGYVRREANAAGTELILRSASGETKVLIVELPFLK